MPTTSSKRSYNSSRRALQAAQTRDEVVRAAMVLFGQAGWAGTTLAAIAEEAGVSVETIYNGFGSKKGLLRATIDAAIVGDTEPVPLSLRPEYRALGEGSLDERIAKAAAITATIHARSSGVWQALVEAAGADEEVDGWRLELDHRRREQIVDSITLILGHPLDDDVTTMVWILFSAETYLKLVEDGGFTREQYDSFLVEVATRLIAAIS
jgi:AcrR family transcriptional regulator